MRGIKHKKIIIEALRDAIKPLAFDANSWDRGLRISAMQQRSSEKRAKLLQAIQEIEQLDKKIKSLPEELR